MASLRHRRGIVVVEAEGEDYDDGSGTAADTDYTATEEEEEEDEEDDHHLGLHSMTAKGIQHLRSELLEIKKASEQDFRANVYLSYLSFIRMFQEAGDLDKDVHRLKRQVIAHRRLIQHLSSNCCLYSSSSMVLLGSGSGANMMMDDKDAFPLVPGVGDFDDKDTDEELELDVLLSEHRLEQALELLELQGQALHSRMQQQQQASRSRTVDEHEAEAAMVASSIRALSARKARVADRLASVVDNPRTPRPELLKALSGLCRLGDAERANHLLFKFHRAGVVRGVEELRASQQAPHRRSSNYIKDLARMVFASIAQASRGFVALHGHPSPYTPQLVRWAREEMEDLGVAFSEYVRSMPRAAAAAAGQSCCLALALEAAECAVSCCSSPLLKQLGIASSEKDVVGLVAPCLREAVAMYGRHLKEVVRLLVASESDASGGLGRFLMPPPPAGGRAASAGAVQQLDCLLLTTSGRKFVTLIQEVVEDVAWPLLNLGMNGDEDDTGALQLVAELFREYMHAVLELIINCREEDGGEEQYMRQLSILINCTTLVSLFPIIVSNDSKQASDSSSSSQRQQVDSLVSLIKEAAGQVWNCFCKRFIRDTMSASAAQSARTPPPAHGMMPSPAFQAVFLRLRRLKNHPYGKDGGDVRKLLQELMQAVISWLSGNLDSWVVHRAQTQLDVHFLLELAQLGGFSSDSIRSSALELLGRALVAQPQGQQDAVDACRGEAEEEEGCGWAAEAARQAVLMLMMGMEATQSADAATSAHEADEDQSGGGAARSSDEFISIEEEEEENDDAQAAAAHEMVKKDDDAIPILQVEAPPSPQQDDDEEEVSGERDNDDVSCEETNGGGGGEGERSKGSGSATNAPSRRSRRKREAVSRSSRPRWQ